MRRFVLLSSVLWVFTVFTQYAFAEHPRLSSARDMAVALQSESVGGPFSGICSSSTTFTSWQGRTTPRLVSGGAKTALGGGTAPNHECGLPATVAFVNIRKGRGETLPALGWRAASGGSGR